MQSSAFKPFITPKEVLFFGLASVLLVAFLVSLLSKARKTKMLIIVGAGAGYVLLFFALIFLLVERVCSSELESPR